MFTGSIDSMLSGLTGRLQGLYVSDNNFVGSIPSSICNFKLLGEYRPGMRYRSRYRIEGRI